MARVGIAVDRPRGAGLARLAAFVNARIVPIIATALLGLLALFILYPLLSVLVKSLLGEGGVTLRHYGEFFSKRYYYRSFVNSMILGLSTMGLTTVVGFVFAYMTTRGPLILRRPLKVIALAPLVAPSYIFAISLIILLGRRGMVTQWLGIDTVIYGWSGVILAQVLAFLPLSFLMIEHVLRSLNPNLEDAANDLGATEGTILKTVILPLSAPGVLKAGLLVFVMAVSEFGNPAMLGGRLSFLAPDTYLMITGEGRFEMASVLSVVLLLPCLGIFMLHNYWLKGRGYTTIVGKPVAAEERRMSPLLMVPCLGVCLVVSLLILSSFGVIVLGSFVKLVGIDNTVVLEHLRNTASNDAILNSIKMSLLAGFIGAVIGVLLAYIIMRGNIPGRGVLELIALLGFALPGTVIGVGYILAFNASPFYLTGTMLILVLNCVFRFLAVAVEAGISKLHQISAEIEEASLDLGAGFLTTFMRITLPLMFSAFVAGFVYTFMTSIVSLSSVIFLIAPGTNLASVYIFITAQLGEMGLASATTVKLIAIVVLCMAGLHVLSRRIGVTALRGGS